MTVEKMPESERGEGNYKATKDYDRRSEEFVAENREELARLAREAAAALDGAEGEELKQAEDEGRSHARK
jgi:hypothetical protein